MNLAERLSTLESPIFIRPTRRMTQGELESYLDKAADILRGNADTHGLSGVQERCYEVREINEWLICGSMRTFESKRLKVVAGRVLKCHRSYP